MTGKKISDLTAASALGDSDKLVVEQSGVAKSITGATIKQDAVAGLDSSIAATTGQAISAVTITDGKITASSKVSVGETNQNAFSNVKVGSSTIAAGSKTDTVELVAGTNVTLTPDTTNKKVTISASGGGGTSPIDVYSATVAITGLALDTATITLGGSVKVSDLKGSKPSALYIKNYDSATDIEFNVLMLLNVDQVAGSTYRIDGLAYCGGRKQLVISGNFSDLATTLTGTLTDVMWKKRESISLVAADWVTGSGGGYLTQTVSLTAPLKALEDIWISPDPADIEAFAEAKIYCYSGTVGATGSLEFRTIGTPTISADIDVNVVWM